MSAVVLFREKWERVRTEENKGNLQVKKGTVGRNERAENEHSTHRKGKKRGSRNGRNQRRGEENEGKGKADLQNCLPGTLAHKVTAREPSELAAKRSEFYQFCQWLACQKTKNPPKISQIEGPRQPDQHDLGHLLRFIQVNVVPKKSTHHHPTMAATTCLCFFLC